MDTVVTNAPVLSSPVSPLPDIVQRYLDGESIPALAKQYGKSFRTLYNWLLTDKGEAYADFITEGLTNRIADADLLVELAQDNVQVARARTMAQFARMDFERRRPKLYGIKQELNIDKQITVIVQRQTPLPVVDDSRIIESQVVSTQEQADVIG